MTPRALAWAIGTATLVLACRGEPPASANPDALAHLIDSLRSPVERATGLYFKSPPRSALRTRQQVRAYLVQKLDQELEGKRAGEILKFNATLDDRFGERAGREGQERLEGREGWRGGTAKSA